MFNHAVRNHLRAGDRRGNLMCWDVSTASSGWGARDAHAGHVTALTWQLDAQQEQLQRAPDSSTLVLSGGQDGCLRVWDGRSGSRVAQQRLHASAQGKGAIGGIVTGAHRLRLSLGLITPCSPSVLRNDTGPAVCLAGYSACFAAQLLLLLMQWRLVGGSWW